VVHQPVSIASIAPTILSLAGAPGPAPTFDVGPLPLDDLSPTSPVFASVAFEPVRPENADKAARADAVILGSRKLIIDHQRQTTATYDLAADPAEATPLPPDIGDPDGTLRTHLEHHLAARKAGATDGTHRAPLAADELETLRTLGYVQ
jgi:arylsulfatase A-like enzyme